MGMALRSGHICMKDADSAASNEKSILPFYISLFGPVPGIFWDESFSTFLVGYQGQETEDYVNFENKIDLNQKIKIGKI